jgi:hypothetical protein
MKACNLRTDDVIMCCLIKILQGAVEKWWTVFSSRMPPKPG